ncbi:hypothetical protein BCR33DRAFT_719454 [Rhizoclosmatium globosum]|uniref:Uncharacterized protein n=1 Tax=Rhizoclosmatium globosum TaxID=329046 RepID=A0A1Y2C0H6_9FUNG|nr:hypothetical protein BCR33DRAFT_719454 [Rhizoclosmatium globosum]|eukprot:ORY40476.1 hypothetical protein BCR33DRAFT_719454 [Rhizoclosmatium globosum]
MQDKAPIEWQDRAWRILQNKGQNEIDVWSAAGATAGFTLFGLTTGKKGGFLVRSLGGVGLGSVIGIASLFAYKKADEFGYVDELKKQWKQAQQ